MICKLARVFAVLWAVVGVAVVAILCMALELSPGAALPFLALLALVVVLPAVAVYWVANRLEAGSLWAFWVMLILSLLVSGVYSINLFKSAATRDMFLITFALVLGLCPLIVFVMCLLGLRDVRLLRRERMREVASKAAEASGHALVNSAQPHASMRVPPRPQR